MFCIAKATEDMNHSGDQDQSVFCTVQEKLGIHVVNIPIFWLLPLLDY